MKNLPKEINSNTFQLQHEILVLKRLIAEKINKESRVDIKAYDKNTLIKAPVKHTTLCPKTNCELTCNVCASHSDFFLLGNTCVSREKEKSEWSNIILTGYRVCKRKTENHLSFTIVGIKNAENNILYSPLAFVTNYLCESPSQYVEYVDFSAEYDNYALSVIIEVLRIIYTNS